MRRIGILLLLLAAVLCGCQRRQTEPTALPATEPAATEPTQPTLAAQRVDAPWEGYSLPMEDCYGIAYLGDNLVVLSGDWDSVLSLLNPQTMEITAQIPLGCNISFRDGATQIGADGLCYYDSSTCQMVFLDAMLQEVERLDMPEDYDCFPVISPDLQTLCYAAGGEIRLLDRVSGIDRRIRTMEGVYTLNALHQNGQILQCTLYGDDYCTLFLSTEDGSTLQRVSDCMELFMGKNTYFATHWDGMYEEKLAGSYGQEPRLLLGSRRVVASYPLPEEDAVVYDEDGTLLYYRLTDGISAYGYPIPQELILLSLCGREDTVWLLFYSYDAQQDYLLRWHLPGTQTNDSTAHYYQRCTPESSDPVLLGQCQAQAAALEAEYGVEILLGQEVLALENTMYVVEPEYQMELLSDGLSKLENALALFPREIYETTKLSVGLVRSMRGSTAMGQIESAAGLTLWSEEGDPCLLLTTGYGLSPTFCHELSHAMDTQVICTGDEYDDWERMNPEEFQYDYDYVANLSRDPEGYLEGEDRCFIDVYSMSFPTEDRARILEYAVQPEMAPYFSSDVMQRKLLCISTAIRQAFALTGEPGSYLWEQYLNNENPEQVS